MVLNTANSQMASKGLAFVSADVRPGGPMIVLRHEELAAVQAQVEAAGGTITKETYSFPVASALSSWTPWVTPGVSGGKPEAQLH